MKLARALKLKNRLVNQVNRNKSLLAAENIRPVPSTSGVDREAVKRLLDDQLKTLAVLKSKICLANHGIQLELELLAESKSIIEYFRNMPTAEEISYEGYGKDRTEIKQSVFLKRADIESIVTSLQSNIDALQDKIDEYNAQTNVDIQEI